MLKLLPWIIGVVVAFAGALSGLLAYCDAHPAPTPDPVPIVSPVGGVQ